MSKLASSGAAAGAIFALSCLSPICAWALAPVTFVSGQAADAGNCASSSSPCRTFQYAHNWTAPGGEVKALDPANYFPLVINKSISIIGVEGAGIIRGTAGDAIAINAGASGKVSLSGLTLDGFNRAAYNGITLNSAASLTIERCRVRNFASNGILLQPTTATKFLIAEVVAADNGSHGVVVYPQSAGSAHGALSHISASRNGSDGVSVGRSGSATADVAVADTVADENFYGFHVTTGATLRLTHSTATKNFYGVFVSSGGVARSAGNNFIDGNTSTDVVGTLTNVGVK